MLHPSLEDDIPAIPDRRLELMLVCAHPAIEPNIRTPLMLQSVLGVEAAAIATAFTVEPSAHGAAAGAGQEAHPAMPAIPFVLPERHDLAERLARGVLEAVYGAYAIDWQFAPRGAPIESLSAEALHLALVLAELLPEEPEVLGLAALVCLSEARGPARRTADGGFVPLGEQDAKRWDEVLIARGEVLLRRAPRPQQAGPLFSTRAAIQSAHCARASQGKVDLVALQRLHRALLRVAPSLGAAVAAACCRR